MDNINTQKYNPKAKSVSISVTEVDFESWSEIWKNSGITGKKQVIKKHHYKTQGM